MNPLTIPGMLRADIQSAGWEVVGASFLIPENIRGPDLQNKVDIQPTQRNGTQIMIEV